MATTRLFDQPTEVVAAEGEVLLDGPDGLAMSMTPAAAEETGRRLVEAAALARRQSGGADQQPMPDPIE